MDNNYGQWGNQPPQDQQWGGQPQQQWGGQPQWNNQPQPQWGGQPNPNYNMPTNWHKFLIFFMLWAGAVLNLINGLMTMTGARYDEASGYNGMSKIVYAYFDGLQIVDIIFGAACIAFAAFMIYTRFQLAGFKTGAPKKLLCLYIGGAIVSIIYLIAVNAIIGGEVDLNMGTIIANLVVSGIMVIVNKIYYDKRAFMFVN